MTVLMASITRNSLNIPNDKIANPAPFILGFLHMIILKIILLKLFTQS